MGFYPIFFIFPCFLKKTAANLKNFSRNRHKVSKKSSRNTKISKVFAVFFVSQVILVTSKLIEAELEAQNLEFVRKIETISQENEKLRQELQHLKVFFEFSLKNRGFAKIRRKTRIWRRRTSVYTKKTCVILQKNGLCRRKSLILRTIWTSLALRTGNFLGN